MIIGISGHKQSGKDTVAKIIQYLIDKDRGFNDPYIMTYEYWLKSYNSDLINEFTGWQTKQFASKLKQIVCLLIGCTMEQLEDNDFKEKGLGEEWKIGSLMNLVECNNCGSVKDTLPIDPITPRKLLQLLGTDCGRNIIHPNIWVNALFADYYPYPIKNDTDYVSKWIITDVRFPNEVKAIEDKKGIVIRIERNFFNREVIEQDQHESEISLDNHIFKYTIINDGSISTLIEMVHRMLKSYKII